MVLTTADARRWLEGFEAAERADIDARRQHGPQPQWSIAVSLSLLSAARQAAGGRMPVDPRRAERDRAARAIWDRLRSRVRR